MFKKNISDNAKFWCYCATLMLTGFALFVLSIFLYPPFKDLAIALNSKETAPLSVWLISGGAALFYGALWLCVFILFETAKKGIVDLLHKQ